MKPLVIYHADCADGFGAAFAAWLKFGDNAEYKPMKYGDALSPDHYEARDVYILDFSFPRETMNGLFNYASRVVWLDHHKSAFESFGLTTNSTHETCRSALDIDVDAIANHVELDNTRSGALIAWEYFHPDKPVPLAIRHIDDYDRWQFKIEGTKEFVKALWSYAPWRFTQWDTLRECGGFGPETTDTYKEMTVEGTALLRGHNQNVQSLVSDAIICEILLRTEVSARGLAVNSPHLFASDLGHELANRSGTYGLVWQMGKDGRIKCSIRSNGDYDVSAIAKELGGGGHRNAAGFTVSLEQLSSWFRA